MHFGFLSDNDSFMASVEIVLFWFCAGKHVIYLGIVIQVEFFGPEIARNACYVCHNHTC